MPNLWWLLGPLASSVVNRISKLKQLIGRTLGASRSTASTEFNEELEKFRKSQIDEIIVTGVSGAVIAQVALTALSLVDIKKTHWTTRGFFFLSVIAACICVIAACINQSVLSSFFDCGFTDWVTKSRGSSRKPSRSAVLKLAFPGQCLFLAVAFFVVGLSEYLGCLMNVSTTEFIKERADFRNIFIVYMVGLGCFLIWIVLIFVLDRIEHLDEKLWDIGAIEY